MRKLAVLLLFLAPLPFPAYSAERETIIFNSGNSLAEACGLKGTPAQPVCDWFIAGAIDAFGLAEGFCFDVTVKGSQLRAITLKYLAGHPEIWHEAAAHLVHNAVVEAFPCAPSK